MTKEVLMPRISENVDSGTVLKILVKVGDSVEAEQPLAEFESDKANFDVPSPLKGKIAEVNIKEGQTAKTGQVIFKIDAE